MHVPKILATISFHDDVRLERGRIFPFPEEKLLSIPFKTDLNQH